MDFTSITVRKGKVKLEIDNPTGYRLIGQGAQGAVFKISEGRCVKIYRNRKKAKMEARALKTGQHLSFMPRLYKVGSNYVIREYFNAPTLKEHLENSMFMTESMAKKLIIMLKGLKQAGYTMVDAPLRHIFVMDNGEIKVIDHVNAYKREHPAPVKLWRDLKKISLKDSFLMHVQRLEPEMYRNWQEFFIDDTDFKALPAKGV